MKIFDLVYNNNNNNNSKDNNTNKNTSDNDNSSFNIKFIKNWVFFMYDVFDLMTWIISLKNWCDCHSFLFFVFFFNFIIQHWFFK
jgi:hypothetical protein